MSASLLLLILAGGYLAGLQHVFDHYENKDETAGLSMDDLVGSYHGVTRTSGLLLSLDRPDHADYLTDPERAALRDWLQGNSVSESYDNLELGDQAPAEIMDRSCLSCHARDATEGDGVGERIPLEYWDDVKRFAFSKELDPVPTEILVVSTHTHAPSMAVMALVTSLLFVCTGWPRALRHGITLLTFLCLFVDLACWWLARWNPTFTYGVIVGGGGFGAFFFLQILGSLADLWFGRRPDGDGITPLS